MLKLKRKLWLRGLFFCKIPPAQKIPLTGNQPLGCLNMVDWDFKLGKAKRICSGEIENNNAGNLGRSFMFK